MCLKRKQKTRKKPRKAGKGRSVWRIIPQENSSYEEVFLRKLQEKRDAHTHAQKRRRRRGVSEAVQSGVPMAGTIRFPLLSCSLRTPLHSSQHWIRSTSKTSMNAIMSRKSCQVRAAAHEGRTAKTTTVGAADTVDSMSCTKIEDSVESTQQQWNTGLHDDFVVHEARLDEELWVRCL